MRRVTKAKAASVRAPDAAREKLLEAAGIVFARAGFRHGTVREICGAAGVNVAAVNYHFGGKLGLYEEVLKLSFQRAKSGLDDIDVEDPREALRAALRVMLTSSLSVVQEGRHERLMTHELAEPSPVLADVVEHSIRPRYSMLCAIVGKLLSLPPKHAKTRMCAHSIIGQALHFVHAKPVVQVLWPEFRYTAEGMTAAADHIADFCLHAIDCFSDEWQKDKLKRSKATTDARRKRSTT